jgi:hypothetical protein
MKTEKISVFKFYYFSKIGGVQVFYQRAYGYEAKDEENAFISLDRIINNKKFLTSEFLDFKFPMPFDDDFDCPKLVKKYFSSINLANVLEVKFEEMTILVNE